MGPEYWKPQSPTHLKKCQEHHIEECNPEACCAVVPCDLCLEWEIDPETIEYGRAVGSGVTWIGTIAGAEFYAFWTRNEEGLCQFVVMLDGVEVARLTCGVDADCRNPEGEVATTIGYESGTLRWKVYEPRELHYVRGEDGCRTYFCGECECSCKVLCVTVIPAYASILCTEDVPDVSTDLCEGPVWEGSVTCLSIVYDVSLRLERDETDGSCLLLGMIKGEEVGPVVITNCRNMEATFTLSTGERVEVVCKVCTCDTDGCGTGCCLPADFTNPTYPGGVMTSIPFCITSSCVADPLCGTFEPIDPTSPGRGPCGFCATYRGTVVGVLPGRRTTGLLDLGTGLCGYTPCSVAVCFVLECKDDEPLVEGLNRCCSKLRLWIGTAIPQEGDIGESPEVEDVTCNSWKKVAPTMCECDGEGGAIASFPINITFPCDDFWVGGPCDGLPKCCQIACTDFELVI